jgi:hypothetical protein
VTDLEVKPFTTTPQQIKNQQQKAQQEYASQVRKELTKRSLEPQPGALKPLSGNIISPIDVPRNAKERERLWGGDCHRSQCDVKKSAILIHKRGSYN